MTVYLGRLDTQGRRAMGCEHMAAWLPWFDRMAVKRGYVRECVDIVQAQGDAARSAGTHNAGTALDLAQTQMGISILARQMGASGAWPRTEEFGWTTGDHTHLMLDCPCESGGDYQITEVVRDGGDGLVGDRRDYVPYRGPWRDYAQGIAWAKEQLGEELDMDENKLRTIIRDETRKVVREELAKPMAGPWAATWGGVRAMDKIAQLIRTGGK